MESLIAKNFSRSSRTYAASGEFQRFAADRMYDFIQRELPPPRNCGRVLELGCGTGFLTIGLLELFPGAAFVVSDISQEMLRQCIDNTRDSIRSRSIESYFKCYNIAAAKIENYYDLIISALAFQWVTDLNPVLANIRDHLHPGGKLVFSTLLDGTFSLLHRAFVDVGAEYPGPRLLTELELRRFCNSFSSCRIEVASYRENYSSVLAFLERIQLTGTGNPSGQAVPVGVMRRVIRRCEELAHDQVVADYQIAYVLCE